MIKSTLTNHKELLKENPDLFHQKDSKRSNIEYVYKIHRDRIDNDTNQNFFKGLYGEESSEEEKFRTETMRGYLNKNHKISYCKSMDAKMNGEAERILRDLAFYIESAHKIKVRKLICSFLSAKDKKIYLLRINELFFDFSTSGGYGMDGIAGNFSRGAEIDVNELLGTIQMYEDDKKPRQNPL